MKSCYQAVSKPLAMRCLTIPIVAKGWKFQNQVFPEYQERLTRRPENQSLGGLGLTGLLEALACQRRQALAAD